MADVYTSEVDAMKVDGLFFQEHIVICAVTSNRKSTGTTLALLKPSITK
jgi:hypothetical protein